MIQKLDECGVRPWLVHNVYRKYTYYYKCDDFGTIKQILLSHIWTAPVSLAFDNGAIVIGFIVDKN